ncbi:hypothetical protein BBD46_05375 [Natrialba sp. SSL1]|nr:hypothetical protein BBD46_05375 [Natrialba sp. SSL1]
MNERIGKKIPMPATKTRRQCVTGNIEVVSEFGECPISGDVEESSMVCGLQRFLLIRGYAILGLLFRIFWLIHTLWLKGEVVFETVIPELREGFPTRKEDFYFPAVAITTHGF